MLALGVVTDLGDHFLERCFAAFCMGHGEGRCCLRIEWDCVAISTLEHSAEIVSGFMVLVWLFVSGLSSFVKFVVVCILLTLG